MTSTFVTKPTVINRSWHLFDARGKILGRLSTQIAEILMGKKKPYFARNLDCGDFVVVVNAQEIQVTGRKEKLKIYYHHSGYSGGLKSTTLRELRGTHPERIIEHAVAGMLPNNKLKKEMLSRLKVFAGEEHPYGDKIK